MGFVDRITTGRGARAPRSWRSGAETAVLLAAAGPQAIDRARRV